MKKAFLRVLLAAALITFSFAPGGFSATYTTYSSLSAFTAAANVLYTQNFSGYSDQTWIGGIDFIPGVNVTSNMSMVRIFGSSDRLIFAYDDYTRFYNGNAYYQINLSSAYRAAGFEITNWETGDNTSGSVDAGVINLNFADNTSYSLNLNQPNSPAPVFFGVVGNTPLVSIQWYEPHEGGGNNEETTLDNFVAGSANAVPIPSAVWLLGSGLLGLIGFRKRMTK